MIDHLLSAASCGPTGLYGHPMVSAVLGDLHPGGAELTRQMATVAGLSAGDRVLDVGCGHGASMVLLATEFGCKVTGMDADARNVTNARRALEAAGVVGEVVHADDPSMVQGTFDAVLSECTLCLMGDAGQTLDALSARLRPAGHLLLSDVTVEEQAAAFRDVAGIAACLGGALPRDRLVGLVATRLDVQHEWSVDGAISAVRDQIRSRIDVDGLVAAADAAGFPSVRRLVDATEDAWRNAHLGYNAIIARAPQPL